jgi:hypothetical protein
MIPLSDPGEGLFSMSEAPLETEAELDFGVAEFRSAVKGR